jgi:Spy/CpxP family protein refolding chaperone
MNDTNTRFWIALFVTLVFVCGLSIGLALTAWVGSQPDSGPARDQFRLGGLPRRPLVFVSERILNRLTRETDFTDEQREQLQALFAERASEFRELNLEMRERFESEQSRLREDVAAILTPEQMEIFESARRPGRARPGSGGIGPPGGRP